MGWSTKYNGPKIDEALEKGQALRVVNNGWIRLESKDISPISLGDLKNPGNYTIAYYKDGPVGVTGYSPLNVSIFRLNSIIYQCATFGEIDYIRELKVGETIYGQWKASQVSGSISPGATAPQTPVDGATVWFDTSNPEAPSLKLYIGGTWKEVVPDGAMTKEIYDTQNKATDIFAYIDKTVKEASLGEMGTDFDTHIKDTQIHMSLEEKAKWNAGATQDDLNNAKTDLTKTMETKIAEEVRKNSGSITGLTEQIANTTTKIQNHAKDTTLHPTAEKQAEWDNKADPTHKHELDGNVTVDAAHVRGPIPSALMPFDVKERVIVVKSDAERLAIKKNPAHDGDAVCVEAPDFTKWYFIVDDTKLATDDKPTADEAAFKPFVSSGEAIDWSKIKGTPTTLGGYGITDAASTTDVANLEQKITEASSKLPAATDITNLTEIQAKYDEALSVIQEIDNNYLSIHNLLNSINIMCGDQPVK